MNERSAERSAKRRGVTAGSAGRGETRQARQSWQRSSGLPRLRPQAQGAGYSAALRGTKASICARGNCTRKEPALKTSQPCASRESALCASSSTPSATNSSPSVRASGNHRRTPAPPWLTREIAAGSSLDATDGSCFAGQRRMPSAKVVQRDAHAQELQACQQQLRLRWVA